MKKTLITLLSGAVLCSALSCKNRESKDNNGTNNPTAISKSGKVSLTMDGKTSIYDDPIINYVGSSTTFSVTHLNASGVGDFDISSLTTKSLEAGSSWDGVISATVESIDYSSTDVQFTIESNDGNEKLNGSFNGSFNDGSGTRHAFSGTFETNHLVQSK